MKRDNHVYLAIFAVRSPCGESTGKRHQERAGGAGGPTGRVEDSHLERRVYGALDKAAATRPQMRMAPRGSLSSRGQRGRPIPSGLPLPTGRPVAARACSPRPLAAPDAAGSRAGLDRNYESAKAGRATPPAPTEGVSY